MPFRTDTTPARKIIHVDMDAFYASVEQRDDPALRGRPVAVGGSAERGVVAAASYEARVYGVRSAMPSVTARRRCPDLVFVPPRFDVYKRISAEIRTVFAEHTDVIEPLSLDEAYLDVTENKGGIASATRIAEMIRARIRERTGLTASAGVSYNKFLAKLASDQRKPDGLFVVTPQMGADFVADLPVARFHGVGPATAAKMERLGIRTGRDLREQTVPFLTEQFGKIGPYYHGIARGIDERPVRANRIRKSVGAENTFARDLFEKAEMRQALAPILDKVWRHCEATGVRGRTVTLKVKYADFRQITRAVSGMRLVEQRCRAGSRRLPASNRPTGRSARCAPPRRHVVGANDGWSKRGDHERKAVRPAALMPGHVAGALRGGDRVATEAPLGSSGPGTHLRAFGRHGVCEHRSALVLTTQLGGDSSGLLGTHTL